MRRGSIGESIFATYACVHVFPDCTCFLFVTYFAAHRQARACRGACTVLSTAHPASLAGAASLLAVLG